MTIEIPTKGFYSTEERRSGNMYNERRILIEGVYKTVHLRINPELRRSFRRELRFQTYSTMRILESNIVDEWIIILNNVTQNNIGDSI